MNTDNYSRRRFVRRGLTLAGVAFAWSTFRTNGFAREAKEELPASPDEALAELSAGNKRYVTGKNIHHDFGPERPALAQLRGDRVRHRGGGHSPVAGRAAAVKR